jgi:hypothetical protein
MAISESAGAATVSCSLPVDVVLVGGGVVAGARVAVEPGGVHAWRQVHRWNFALSLHPPGALLAYRQVYTVEPAVHDPAMKGIKETTKRVC